MIYNKTVEEIRSWPLVDDWRVDPETNTRVRIGNHARIGECASIGKHCTSEQINAERCHPREQVGGVVMSNPIGWCERLVALVSLRLWILALRRYVAVHPNNSRVGDLLRDTSAWLSRRCSYTSHVLDGREWRQTPGGEG